MNYIIVNGELYHAGVKGMKWGVRRYQNKDGSLTPAGKKRYNDSGGEKQKSKHRLKLETKYRKKGMTQRDAENAAAKRIKTEKIVGVMAGVTVAAASAYFINKYVKDRTDTIIKAGTTVQRITQNPNESYDRPFYAAYKKGDTVKYKGLMGANHFGGKDVHKVLFNVESDIKVASRKKAADTFVELYKNDSEFREAFKKSNRALQNPEVASRILNDGQLRKAGYDAFNIGLVNHDENSNAIAKKFYNKLKSQGYDAIVDINDKKYSGYDAKSPLIVFNKTGKMSAPQVSKMDVEEMISNLKKARANMHTKDITMELAKTGAMWTAGGSAIAVMSSSINSHLVNKYRIKHPNSELTDKQILQMLSEQRS